MRLVKYHAYRESIALHLSERSEESREMLRCSFAPLRTWLSMTVRW
jgi:hypothetical protein